MNVFSKIGIPEYHGATISTLIGLTVSTVISIIYLTKKMNFNYKETIKTLPKFVLSILILIPMIYLFNKFLPIQSTSRIIQLINLTISGVVCGGTYLLINFKHIKLLLPERLLSKLKLNKEK